MAQEARDKPPGDPEPFLSSFESPADAGNNCLEGDASSRVGLGVEEDLRVHDALTRSSLEVRRGEVEEVELGDQDGAALVVDVEERLEIVEDISASDALNVRVRQGDPIANGELEHQLGFQRAFDVDMELGLGQAKYERVNDSSLLRRL
jgi:hypothetical protein